MENFFILSTPRHRDVEDPTVAEVLDVAKRLIHSSVTDHSDYFIVENVGRAVSPEMLCFMQSRPHRSPAYEGIFTVEVRDGEARRQLLAHVKEDGQLESVFASYLNGNEEWRELAIWHDISYQFPDLKASMPPEELASSYFEEGEYERGLAEKERRDKEFWELMDGPGDATD